MCGLLERTNKKKKAPNMPLVHAYRSIDGELYNSKWGAVHHNNEKRIEYAFNNMRCHDLIPCREDFVLFVQNNKKALLEVLNSLEDEDFENEYAENEVINYGAY